MGNVKEFKYKIDLELGAKDFSPEIAKMFSKVQQQADKEKVVLTLTGDDKDIVNQLTELKTKIPNLDLSKAITVGFSDALKEDGDKAQKYAQNFLTNIVNSVSEALKSIDNIKGRIKDTEANLKTAEKDVDFLGAGDADKALQNLTKRFQGIKAEEKNIDKLRGIFQQIKDIAASTGKEIPEGVKKYQENLKTAFKQDIFKDIKPSKTYDQYMEEASSKVFELRNQLFNLKKELETAENPEIQVKGKLADNFIGDLQSQLDQMTGIEVKVKPKIDKDVKLEVEVEGDVKPAVQPNEKIELPKPAEKIDLGKYDLSKIEVVNEKLSEYKSEAESISESAQKAVDELNKFTGKSYTLDRNMFDIPSTLREWNKASMSANDFKKEIKAALEANEKEKAAILYENLKTYYPKTTATLDIFKDKDFKDNYDSYLSRGKTKEQAMQLNPDLQRYRVLEDAIHQLEIEQGGLVRETAKANAELEKQAKISSELSKYNISTKDSRNSAIQSLDQQIAQKEAEMERMLELDKNFQSDYHKLANARVDHESTEEYSQILEKYNIPKGSGLLQSVQYLASQRGELQETIDILKGVRQAISESNEAISAPPNTSGMDKVEEELHEEAAAANEAAKAERAANEARNFRKDIENNSLDRVTPRRSDFSDKELFDYYNVSSKKELNKAWNKDYQSDKNQVTAAADKVLELQNKLNSFSTDHSEKELKELRDELYAAEVEFAHWYETLDYYSEGKSTKTSSDGLKKYVQDLYGQINSKYSVEENITKAEPDINKVRDTLGKIMNQMNTSQITGRNLFDWIKENASEAEKELFDVSKGFEEFQKLLVGASFGSRGLFEYRDGAGLDIFNYNKNTLPSDTLIGKSFDELVNVSNIKQGSDELNAALRESMEHLKAMYDAGDTESEEYIGTLYRIINLQKEMWKFNGGKGFGFDNLKNKTGKDADSKMNLQDSIFNDFMEFSGTPKDVVDFVSEQFANLKSRQEKIFDDKGLISVSTYKSVQQVIDSVGQEFQESGQQATTAVDKIAEINEQLEIEKTKLKEIEDQQKENDSALNALNRRKEDPYSYGGLDKNKPIYDTGKLKSAADSLKTFNTQLDNRNKFQEKYNNLIEIIQKNYLGKYGISNGLYDNVDDFIKANPSLQYLERLSKNGIKGERTKDINEAFSKAISYLQSEGRGVSNLISNGDVYGIDIIKEIETEEERLAQIQARLHEEREAQLSKIYQLQQQLLENSITQETQQQSEAARNDSEALNQEAEAARTDAEAQRELTEAKKEVTQTSNEPTIPTTTSSTIDEITQVEQREAEQATATAAAEENLSNVVSQEEHPSDVRERIDELKEEKAAADEAAEAEENYQSHVYKNQSGKVSEGNYSYTRYDDNYRNSALKYRGVVSTDSETGESGITERLVIDYDKLLSEILKYDTQIYKLEQDINNAQGDTSGLEKKKQLAEDNLKLYTDLLEEISTNPDYVTNANQEQLNYIQERRDLKKQELEADAQIAKANQDETQKQEAINSQMKVRANYYQKMWELRSKMHLADPEKDADQISTWKDRLNTYKQIYDAATQTLKQLDAQKVVEQDITELAKIRQEVGAKYNDSRSKQKDTQRANDEKALQKQVMDAANAQKRLGELRALQYQAKENPYMANDSDYMKTLDSLISKYNQEANAIDRNKLSKEQIKILDDAIAESELKVQKAIEQVTASQNKQSEAGKKQQQVLDSTRASVQKQASALTNNGKLMKVYGDQVRAYIEEIKNPTTTLDRLNDIRVELNKISAEAIAAGQSGKSFFQVLQQRAQSLLAYLGTFVSFYRVVGYVKEAINTIRELDTELVDLRKTTKMTSSELNQFYLESNKISKEFGVATKEIISQAAAWSRLGYNTREASVEMAKLSSLFATVSPGMTTENSTDYLVSTMQAFGIAVDDVERKILDNVNSIGNAFATTNAEIGEMLTRSSAAMNAANNSLEETIALESAAVEITRNAETTGTAFRTISMRIRGLDEETEEALEDYEELKGKIADLTKTDATPGGISLFTDATKTEFKSTYQILKEISQVWDKINDKDQAALLETLAGKRGGQVLAGILNDFSSVDEALKTMEESGGSAQRELSIVQESIDYKVNKLKETWTGFLQETVTRDFLGDWVDRFTTLSEVVTNLSSKFGILKTALIGIGTVVGSHKLGLFQLLRGDTSGIKNFISSINEVSQAGKTITEARAASTALSGLTTITSGAVDISNLQEYRNILNGLTDEQKALALSTSGLNAEQAKMVLTYSEGEFATTALTQAEANRIVTQSGLLGASQLLNAEEMTSLATKTGLTEIQLRQALQEAGAIVTKEGDVLVTKELNKAEIEQALISKSLAKGNEAETASIIAETAAKSAATNATTKFAGGTNLLVGAFSKLKTVIVAHPIIAILATITAAVGAFVIHEKKHKEEIEKIVDESVAAYDSATTRLKKGKENFDDISKEFVELSKGVNSVGDNVSLTTDEYKRYHEVANQLADITPSLVKAWDDQGNAILRVKDSVEQLSAVYTQEVKDANNLIISAGSELIENSTNKLVEGNVFGGEDYSVQDRLNNAKELLKKNIFTKEDIESFKSQIPDPNDLYGGFIDDYTDLRSMLTEAGIDTFGMDYQDENSVLEFLNNMSEKDRGAFEAYITKTESTLSSALADRKKLFKAYFQNALLDSKIDSDIQNTIYGLADTLDNSILEGLDSEEAISDYVNNIINAFEKLSPINQEKITEYVNLNTMWNNDKLSYEEYVEKIQALMTLLEQLFPGDKNEQVRKSFMILFDVPDEEELANKQDIFVNRLGKRKNLSIDTTAVKKEIENIDKELERMQKKGSVNLKLRPEIDTEELKKAGWDEIEDGIATIYSSTFSNEDETKWINFTPIIVDPETGEYKGVLTPEELEEYAQGVIDGTKTDDLNLKIGGEFDTEEQAVAAAEKIHNLHERLSELRGDVDKYGSKSIAGMPSDVENKLKNQGTEVADAWYDSLTKSQQEFVDNLSDEDLAKAVRFESTEEFDEWLEKLTADANLKIKPDTTEFVKDLNDLESKWTTLNSALSTASTGETLKASTIQGVTDAFGGVGKDSEGNINALSAAVEDYNKKLVENPGNVEVATEASNNLATASLDLTGALEELIDKDEEYAKQVLKDQGAENAEEVVQSRLNKTYKVTRSNLEKLAKTMASYREELKKSNKTAADFSVEEGNEGQFADITKDVSNLLGQYNQETGELVAPANIDGQFMADNWGLVQDSIEGVDGALDQLYIKLAMVNAEKVMIEAGLDETEIDAKLGNIQTMLDIASSWTMEPQALLEDSQFKAALQSCWDGSVETANAINAALGTIGMKVQYKTTTKKIRVANASDKTATSIPTSVGDKAIAGKTVTADTIAVDDFEVVATPTGKGTTGTGVNLGPSSGTGTGGGDGGGGGNGNDSSSKDKNKAQKNAAETFDWIEVYIKRIEEEIARLDKDATNVYKKWEDRNTSLAKEMAKVTEQIKAQRQAAEEYSRNANLVTGSGQLLTEKQNTAVKKAQKAWTNKLQQKIIDGDYTLTEKKKNGKTKTKLNTKKLEKDLGNAYNTYIKDAAQELFSLVKKNNKKKKKTKVQKNIIVGDNNKPKKSDYGDNTAQYKADLKDWKKAQEIWATGKYQEKILNGQITGKDIEQISNKYLVDAIKNTSEWVQKSIDENDEIQDLKIKLADLNKEELDNILKKWEQIIDVTQREVDDIDDMISRVETMGYWVSTDWLEKQNEKSATMVFKYDADLEEAKNKLNEWVRKQEDEGKLYKDSEYYKEAVANLDDLTNKRNQELNKIEERNKKAREIIKEQFDYIEERLDGITKEAEALIEMASIEKTMDEYGNFNDRGMLKLAMVGAKFEEAERKLEDYTKRRQELEEQLLHDPMNKDLLAEVDEVRQGEYDMWKELASDYNEAASVFKESIDAHLNKLKEIIDDYKSALSAAKDLYEFQKNIGNQTKNIENLRKQLVAYQGDDSEAGRKRRQELTNQLNSAEQQLQETEWDRYINQTGEILDNLYNDYEETLNARLDNVEFLMGELITEVNNNAKSVVNGLTETMNTYGLQPSYFKDLLTKDKENAASVTENADANQKKILSGLHKDLYGDDSTLGKITTSLKDYVKSMETAMDDDKLFTKVFGKFKELKIAEDGTLEVVDVTKDKVKVAKPIDNDRPLVHMYDIDEPNINNNKTNTTTAAQEAEQNKKAQEVENLQRQYDDYKAKITQEERKLNDERTKKKPNQEKINQYQKTINEYDALLRQIERELEKYGISTAVAGTLTKTNPFNKTFNNLNTNLLNGFAKGSKGISSTQLAWTNENWEKEGGELIFRKSDGAVLTPLNQGDMVFTADMTQRLWEIAQGMVPTSVGGQKLPNISSNNHSTVNTNNQITISLPNVNDYDSFKRELQNDSRFEKFIQEVTIGQAMGNNTLNKRKY